MHRRVIVNADDFGQSRGINAGIIRAHEEGIVTSASLMVRWPSAAAAASYARDHRALSVGLHLDLGEWRYDNGQWLPVYEVVCFDDRPALEAEAFKQLEIFRDLMHANPTHLDSHQHVHLREPAGAVTRVLADALEIPLRSRDRRVRYCGKFYGQSAEGLPMPELIHPEHLIRILMELPTGISELGCHPGSADDRELMTMYREERASEVKALCDRRVRAALEESGIEVCSFRDVPRVPWEPGCG